MNKISLAEEGFTFGCDPEMFILNEKGEPVSAYGLIPGTKEKPFKVEKGAVQVDGMAAEINIDPVDNWEDFNGNIIAVIKQLKDMLPKGHNLCIQPSVVFPRSVLDEMPDHVKEMGCDPDFNAWSGEVNPKPKLPNRGLRCFGGHLHVGWCEDMSVNNQDHIKHGRDFAQQCDWFLGGWSMKLDKNITRRQLYGQAGAWRPKPYGMEYRVLSNFWIEQKELRLEVWNRLQAAIRDMRKGYLPKLYAESNDQLISYINTGKGKPKGCSYPFDCVDVPVKKAYMPRVRPRRAA